MADVITRFKVESTQYEKKIKDAGNQLDNFKNKGNGANQFLKQFENKMGMSISSMTKFGVAAGAASAALKVMSDAFMTNESCVDSWGRTTDAAKGIYQSFVSSLNNASFSSFLSNINNVIKSAKEAYNALDDLNTKGGIISNKEAKLNYDKSVQMAIINDKNASDADRKAAQERLKELNAQTVYAKEATAALNQNVIFSRINKLLTDNGFVEGHGDYQAAFDRILEGLYDENITLGKFNTGFQRGMKINNGKTTTYTDMGNRNLDNIVTDSWREEINPYVLAMWNSKQAGQDATRASNRFIQKDGSSTGGGVKVPMTPDFDTAYTNMNENWVSSKSWEYLSSHPIEVPATLEEEEQAEVSGVDVIAEKLKERAATYELCMSKVKEYKDLMSVANEEEKAALQQQIDLWNGISTKINPSVKGAEDLATSGKDNTAAWSAAANAMNGVGNALTSMDDPAAKVIGLIAQAVASVAAGAGQAISAKDTTSSGWAWIGAAAAITSEMVAIISTIKSSTSYHADGGIVGSNSLKRGTDTVSAMLTPGELVLNRAQQTNLASQLYSVSDSQQTASVGAEDIVIKLNNYGRRTGQGRIKFE